ncbi:SMI1/KNR4 family protein [Chitinophaga solisilvae]|uniref:SMI1/KNR4 family protein n=1 Tax=Chitinophaga solisilvae TaxID=1233460 RepID=UPI00136AAFC5|nr:SMI1/KNR4 family protein [Chitinophaga solisilvae]
MRNYDTQIARIKEKLVQAKAADTDCKVFGATSHHYVIDSPLTPEEIQEFEQKHQISLPADYKSFLLHIGNGGESFNRSAAGPYYGIYPLGDGVGELGSDEDAMRDGIKIYPEMSSEEWKQLTTTVMQDDISDEDYYREMSVIYAGILPIGTQGCGIVHALALNGPHAGRVININPELYLPQFCYENNFLDWYERWLDEIISGDLVSDNATWFGYSMGGSIDSLLAQYHADSDPVVKKACLRGILVKKTIPPPYFPELETAFRQAETAHRLVLLQLLTKCSYTQARPFLLSMSDSHLLEVVQNVWWYAKDNSADWLETISRQLPQVHDAETFRFCTYLLSATATDYGPLLLPMTQHPEAEIRSTSFYTLGKLPNKADYLDAFIAGLKDSSNDVIRNTLQALAGITDKRLLPAYHELAARFPEEQDYVLSNLRQRLKEM